MTPGVERAGGGGETAMQIGRKEEDWVGRVSDQYSSEIDSARLLWSFRIKSAH